MAPHPPKIINVLADPALISPGYCSKAQEYVERAQLQQPSFGAELKGGRRPSSFGCRPQGFRN